jgi:hypothetical protein
MSDFTYDATHFTNANQGQIIARLDIRASAVSQLKFDDTFFRDLPLFLHSGILARILAVEECYLSAKEIPGLFLDFGTWKGSNMILLENFRAIHDPFDTQRRIIGIDTFSGYKGFEKGESSDPTIQENSYSLDYGYEIKLQKLVNLQEKANGKTLGRHKVIKGDAVSKLSTILADEGSSPVALSFFDMNAFVPTRDCLETIIPRLISGSMLGFWQFSRPEISGERRAFEYCKEKLPLYRMFKSKYYPSLVYVKIL